MTPQPDAGHDLGQELKRQPAGRGVQPQPVHDATVGTKLGVRFVCEDRQSEPQWNHRTDV